MVRKEIVKKGGRKEVRNRREREPRDIAEERLSATGNLVYE